MLFLYFRYNCKSYPVTVVVLQSVVTASSTDQPWLRKEKLQMTLLIDLASKVNKRGSKKAELLKNKIQACMGFEPLTSAIPVQRST